MATVKLFGNLRQLGVDAQMTTTEETVRAVIGHLCAGNEGLGAAIFDGDKLAPHVRVMINGKDIELLAGLDTAVTPADKIAIFPPIAGGASGKRENGGL